MTENNRKDISCIKNSLKIGCQNGRRTIFICGLGHFFYFSAVKKDSKGKFGVSKIE
jgi:hypothetical protein